MAGRGILVKAGCLQHTGSFKARGGWSAVSALPPEVRARGVSAYSSGNSQGVARAAAAFGIPAVIVMPSDAPSVKIGNTRALGAEVVLYERASESREGMDLRDMRLPGRQDELIARVARANPRTIVVLQTGGPVEMPWIDEVPAVLQAWYPGQEIGHAIADVLLGHAEPGGRLPQSFPVTMADMPPLRKPGIAYPGENGQVRYEEGLFIGYRHFDRADAKPLFAFGHGLSYSQFRWSEPVLENFDAERGEARVAVQVENIGSRSGCEVVQLYVAPDEPGAETPIKTLRAFGKCSLAPGESTEIALQLRLRDFARFDAKVGDFVAPPGCYMLIFARSATEEVARLTLELPALRSEPGLE